VSRFTAHQVPRGARPDGAQHDRDLLVKNVSCLRLTHQIRLLTFKVLQQRRKLVILVPMYATIHATLRDQVKAHPRVVRIERID